jgi:phage terminase large subunit-like protein
MSSGVALYMLAADGDYGATITSSACTADQARIVWSDARAMTLAAPSHKLMTALGIEAHAHTITVKARNSSFRATSAEYQNLDGLNLSLGVVDELHQHPDRGLWDVLTTAAGKRPQSMIWAITTAGSDRAGICYEQRTYLTKILDGVTADDTFFGCIWHADDTDDWQSEDTWKKANPAYDISVEPSYIAALARKAQQMPAAQSAFKTKHLNIWVGADSQWMDMLAWDKCKEPGLSIEDFAGESCVIGLDLASKVDVAAKIKLFRKTINSETHYYVFGNYYLPESAVEDGRNSQYPGWSVTGQLTVTPGNVIDFQQIEDDLMDDAKKFRVEEISYDPWQSEQLAQRLTAAGAPSMIEYRPTVQNFSAPMKEIDALVRSGRLHHNDPILTWMVSNVVCHTDNKDNIFPRKERPENKIDGLVALLMAMGRWMAQQFDSVYAHRGLLVLGAEGSYTSL